jgi:hypothetical protein
MKLNNLAKTVMLGLAVFVATAAFAGNSGTFLAHEAVEINGQQLAAGTYQVRWSGTGSNAELSFMKGNKEVAKTTARIVPLNQAPSFDSATVDHSDGKATVSEIRFAGKKTAFALGVSDRAAMGDGSK